ncbi:aldehyde dehydrogenase family protein [Peptoniphilus indolicus]|uniref:Aldehyde dehydrogenase n=2 Tax=Peptoniphilus indolicus TaxID=33030 RepID=G4D0V7_9FIRM|nr:aldehyde dehydrogenase family protein [Peptoniphilus indolicus]EGY80853.1 aldehyde dehydrogenase [Peptoniphilus indolicus ATCC 29427]SUB74733.1 Putative aldehyde dehydrogenase AldA [Peptoniphilus indolicus]
MSFELKKEYRMFIGGEWREASDGQWLQTFNPATGEVLSQIPQATNDDVDDAVEAAKKAFETFKDSTAVERQALLTKIADIIDENAEYLATIESMDNGKPIRETMGADIPLAADHFRYFAAAARMQEGTAQMLDKNTLNLILHEPIGVVGQIVPWNFPFLMAAWKLAPVLAAGDVTILKPSSSTSLSVLALMELIQDVVPAGVINVITGSGSKSGEYLQHHKGIDKLAFTGSTEVGRGIGIAAAERIIPATLELGGKSANIFFEDADMDVALEGVQLGILFNQGQVCSAGSRIFVQESFYDEFVEKVVEAFKKVKVGDPLDPETQMGAQASMGQLRKILDYVEIGQKEGAKILTGGNKIEGDGVFMEPTLLGDVTNEMRVAREEIFGPVGVIIKFKDEEDLIRMANDSDYGLGGGVFTKDINKAIRVATGIRTGRVWVNTYNTFPAGAPFGGYKESGIGRETHKVILDHYTQMKNILINLSATPAGMYLK